MLFNFYVLTLLFASFECNLLFYIFFFLFLLQLNLEQETFSPISGGRSIIDVHHKGNYYIIPQNKLGQDIYIRATELRGLTNIIRMPSGDMKPLKVPVSKNMLDSHLKGKLRQKDRTMLTVIIADAEVFLYP